MFFPHGRGGKRAPAGSAAGRRPSGDVPTCSKATPQPGAQPGAPLSESVAPSLSRTRCSLLGPSRADSAGRATRRGPSPRRWRPSLQLPPPPGTTVWRRCTVFIDGDSPGGSLFALPAITASPPWATESAWDSGRCRPQPSSRTGEMTPRWVHGPTGLIKRQTRWDFTDHLTSKRPCPDSQESVLIQSRWPAISEKPDSINSKR